MRPDLARCVIREERSPICSIGRRRLEIRKIECRRSMDFTTMQDSMALCRILGLEKWRILCRQMIQSLSMFTRWQEEMPMMRQIWWSISMQRLGQIQMEELPGRTSEQKMDMRSRLMSVTLKLEMKCIKAEQTEQQPRHIGSTMFRAAHWKAM